MDRRLALIALAALVLVAGFAVTGCDPKLTGDETSGTDDGPGDLPDPVVTPEALIVGQIATLHAEMLANALALAAEYDTASAGPGPRALFTSQCITTTETNASLPQWSMLMNSCVDQHGTVVTGGGYLEPLTTVDGYALFPYLNDDLIRALNSSDDSYNHTIDQITPGAMEIKFNRTQGVVTGATIDHFLRHFWRAEQITFSFANEMTYTGAVGSFAGYPDGGSLCRVVWDGIGIFEINYQAGGTALYTLQGVQFEVNLTNGNVIIVAS